MASHQDDYYRSNQIRRFGGLWELHIQWNSYSIFEQILKTALGTAFPGRSTAVWAWLCKDMWAAWHVRTHLNPADQPETYYAQLWKAGQHFVTELLLNILVLLGFMLCGWWVTPCLCKAFLYLEVKAEDIGIEGMPAVHCRQNVWKSCFMSAYIIFLYLKRLIIHIVCTVS